MEMLGFDQQGRQESRERFILEKPRHEIELLVHKAEAVEHHSCDGVARGHNPRFWLVSSGTVNDLTNAEFIEHSREGPNGLGFDSDRGVAWQSPLPRRFYRPLKIKQLARGPAECRFDIRVANAAFQLNKPIPKHPTNGDEARFPSKIGNFHKGLPTINAFGEVDLGAYQRLIDALTSGEFADFEAIPLGGPHRW